MESIILFLFRELKLGIPIPFKRKTLSLQTNQNSNLIGIIKWQNSRLTISSGNNRSVQRKL
jgi:hypothetical protein